MNKLTIDHVSRLNSFREDVLAGLAGPQKALPSRWLYDDRGCEPFEQITCVDDDYPTRTETAILRVHAKEMGSFCGAHSTVLEHGAGATIKTEILLDALNSPAGYSPIDIADEFLVATVARLKNRFPELSIRPVIVDFTREVDIPAQPAANGARVAFFRAPRSVTSTISRRCTTWTHAPARRRWRVCRDRF
jgi:L-histidine N-alpha-methyltransferase